MTIDEAKANVLKNPDSIEAHEALAQAYAEESMMLETEYELIRIEELSEGNPTRRYLLAAFYYNNGRPDEARPLLESIAAAEGEAGARAAFLAGMIHMDNELYESASEFFRKAAAATPEHPEAWCQLAVALDELGETQEARAAFEKTIEQDPMHAKARNGLGLILSDEGENEMAIEHFRAAIKAQPDYANAHFNLALCLEKIEEIQGAIEAYQKAYYFDNTIFEAAAEQARLLYEDGSAGEAIELLESLESRGSDDPEMYMAVGRLYEAWDYYESAEENYKECLRADPAHAEACFCLGRTLEVLEQNYESMALYDLYLRREPEGDYAEEARACIEALKEKLGLS